MRDPRLSLPLLLAALGLAACGSSSDPAPEPAAPSVESFEAVPSRIEVGEEAELRWSTSGASSVELRDEEGAPLDSPSTPGGVHLVSPAFTTTYTLIASGKGGEATAQALVEVQPAIEALSAEPGGEVVVGHSVEIRWVTAGARALVLENGAGFRYEVPEDRIAAGATDAPVPPSGRFTLKATSGDLETRKTVEVTPLHIERPTIHDFTAEPAVVTKGRGEEVELFWQVEGAVELSLSIDGEDIDLGGRSVETDLLPIEVNDERQAVLTATNRAGFTTSTLFIRAVDAPRIERFVSSLRRVPAGQPFELAWSAVGASSVELRLDGVSLDLGALPPVGAINHSLTQDGTFTLAAFNDAREQDIAELTVSVGGPIIDRFEARSRQLAPKAPVHFSWEVQGGAIASIRGPEGAPIVNCTTTESASIQEGSCEAQVPEALGLYRYVLEISDALDQSAEAELHVRVVEGPTIALFEAIPPALNEGENLEFSWEVEPDMDGVFPTLLLTIGDQQPLELDEAAARAGSWTTDSLSPGVYEILLDASTPGSVPAQAAVTVTVHALPTVQFAAAPLEYDPGLADEVVLSFSAADAASLEIWEIDEHGAPLAAPLFSSSAAEEIAGSSIAVDPAETTTYRAVATNAFGGEVAAELTVTLLLVEITSFTSTPAEVMEGEPIRLQWTTERASHVDLDVEQDYTVSAGTLPFIDLSDASAHPNATKLPTFDTCGKFGGRGVDPASLACPVFTFPGGFAFPFQGETYTEAKMFVDGILSFNIFKDYSGIFDPGPHLSLPTKGASDWGDLLAPLWSDLILNEWLPNAGLYYDLKTDPEQGDHLIVQWSGLSFTHADPSWNPCSAPLHFQAVLWEDGGIDFRYAIDSPFEPLCNGSDATIGIQYAGSQEGLEVSHNTAVPGGLSGVSYSFRAATLTTDGSLDLVLPHTRTFTLYATGARGRTVSQELTVFARRPPRISDVSVAPQEPFAGEHAAIEWSTDDVLSLRVEDAAGVIVCEATSNRLPRGGCSLREEEPGNYTYTLFGEGHLGHEASRQVNVRFWEPLRIHSFTASPEAIDVDDTAPVRLSWETSGGESVQLFAGDIELSLGADSEVEDGSHEVEPTESTTYRLVVHSTDGRQKERSVRVEVRTFRFAQSAASHRTVDGDTPVTLSWELDPLVGGEASLSLEPLSFPLVEAPHVFEDISVDGSSVANDRCTKVDFSESFRFPYFGIERSSAWFCSYGLLSFSSGGNAPTGQPFLEFGTSSRYVELAPFWENLQAYGGVGTLLHRFVEGERPEEDRHIFQWDRMQLSTTPTPTTPTDDDLTFQVALFRDGSFEFRYATMESPEQPERAGGSVATVGYKHYEAERLTPPYRGFELFRQLSNPIEFSNRTYRYQPYGHQGTATFTPRETTEYRLCATLGGYEECRSLVVVVPSPGDLLITELNLDPAGGASEQWFEVRNTSAHPMDLAGMVLEARAGEHRISDGAPLEVEPGDYLILAATDGPVAPDYVYGESLPLGTADDRLAIRFEDRTVAAVQWDPIDWVVPSGRTLSLDPVHQRPTLTESDDFGKWCVDAEEGSPRANHSCAEVPYLVDPFSPRPFIDISQSGTKLAAFSNFTSTTAYLPGGIGFPFSFFGDDVDAIWVSSNGFLGMSGEAEPMGESYEIPDPTSGRPGLIAPLWSRFSMRLAGQTAGVHYERRTIGGAQVLIVQWTDAVRETGSGQVAMPGSVTFQTQLWEDGTIVHAYDTITQNRIPGPGESAAQLEHFGGTGTVGIEAIGGGQGIQYLHHEPILRKGQSLSFQPR